MPSSRAYHLKAGMLRHRVAIQSEVNTRDAIGGVAKTWSTDATVWANIRPLSGRELIAAQQVDSRVTHEITVREYSGLNSNMRFLHESRAFNIVSVRDIDERDKLQICQAIEDTGE